MASAPGGTSVRPDPAGCGAPPAPGDGNRLAPLDGWRGLSIACVLAAHMAPLGPKGWELNHLAGVLGMSLFFTLSGFLITSLLMQRPVVRAFLIRRLCRILPLAWAYSAVVLLLAGAGGRAWAAHLLFTLNYQHEFLRPEFHNGHLWSLCVEVHFYLFVALLVGVAGARALVALPVLCAAVTAYRVYAGATVSIVTHLRVDEILAGATLALVWGGRAGTAAVLGRVPPVVWLAALVAASHPLGGPLQYVRPYFAALLVGATLVRPRGRASLLLENRVLRYLATISYALYVIHPLTVTGWLGEGGGVVRYLVKRPISLGLTFLLAHLSTFYWEAYWIALGKRLTARKS